MEEVPLRVVVVDGDSHDNNTTTTNNNTTNNGTQLTMNSEDTQYNNNTSSSSSSSSGSRGSRAGGVREPLEVELQVNQHQHQHPPSYDDLDDLDFRERGRGRGANTSITRKRGCCPDQVTVDPLLKWTLVGVAVGMGAGLVMNQLRASNSLVLLIGFPGKVFLNLLKMLVLPLLSLSIMCGVASLSKSKAGARKVSRITFGYYLLTTLTAVLIGVAIVNIIRPGKYSSTAGVDCHKEGGKGIVDHPQHEQSALESILQILEQAFPSNLVGAAASMNVLGVVSFSMFFGFVLSGAGEDGRAIIDLIDRLNRIVTRMVEIVLKLTPVGVCSLIAASIADACDIAEMAKAIALYMVTVIVGLSIQGLAVLPCLYWITTRKSPLVVLRGFTAAFVTAFGTDSSSATLPVTLRCATGTLGLQESIANFVLPLGATINMNGTALYEALTVIFIAQRHNVTVDMGQTFIIVITGTMAAVGAAAIPSAGLVTMLMVLQAVGLSEFASDIALVITVDWLLDRIRTVVNVEGDAFGVALVDHMATTPD